jgi:SNF2-related domain
MIEINPTRFKFPPYKHQLQGTKDLVTKPTFNLFWEMRTGKTKAVIDAACLLFEAGVIDTVVIACPAQVKPVWLNPEFGELKQHVFVSYRAIDLEAKIEDKLAGYLEACHRFHVLPFIVVSYEFLRQEDAQTEYHKVGKLVSAVGNSRYWMVCDEGCALGNWEAAQTRALYTLRQTASRVTILDGTPIGNSPLTLYTKFKLLQTKLAHRTRPILGFREFSHYKRFIAVEGQTDRGKFKKVIGWKNLEEVTRRGAPYCSRVEAKDVLDMPRMVPGIIQASLSEKSWKVYKDLRDQMVAWVDGKENVIQHAHVKVLRLAQVCGGFLGGFDSDINFGEKEVRCVGDEALCAVLDWLRLRFEERPDFKVVIWVRFRAEIERYFDRISRKYQDVKVTRQYGDVKDYDGELHPKHPFTGAFVLIVQQQAAQYGMNFSKADTEVFASQDYNVVTRSQSEVRLQAPDTRSITSVIDLLVTGPQGQKTVTHDIVKSLREKEDLGRRTAARWKQVLTEE